VSTSRCCCGQGEVTCPGICPCSANLYAVKWTGTVNVSMSNCSAGIGRYYGIINISDGITRALANATACRGTGSFSNNFTATYYTGGCVPTAPGGSFIPCTFNQTTSAACNCFYELLKPDRPPGICKWRVSIRTCLQMTSGAGVFPNGYFLTLLFEQNFTAGTGQCNAPGNVPYVQALYIHPTLGVNATTPQIGHTVAVTDICDVLDYYGSLASINPGALTLS